MAEQAPKKERRISLERIKGWKGWLVAIGVVATPIVAGGAALAALEGIHIGAINNYQSTHGKGKKAQS